MLIVRTPMRVSLFGGGTDYPSWFLKHGGEVISSSINKYSYITARQLPPFFAFEHRIRYYHLEEAQNLDDIKHPVVREATRLLGFEGRLDIVHNADLPARSGLGSSSTFSVGMLHALHTMMGRVVSKDELAEQAIHLEQHVIGESVGSQDQVAAAFGGFNHIRFSRDKQFQVTPVAISKTDVDKLQDSLLLCFTGFSRTASEIASHQESRIEVNFPRLTQMGDLVAKAMEVLTNGASVAELGLLLSAQWELKRGLSGAITNDAIDEMYRRGMRAGAAGAKLLGAGGGGFMLFIAEKAHHDNIRSALGEKMFVPIRFENSGSTLIYLDRN